MEISKAGTTKPFDPYASEEEGWFGEGKPPWWKDKLYYPLYRFWKWHKIFHPTEIYYEVKWFIQRGRRGWADCDTWSLDDYLAGWLPDALTYLKEKKHGIPCGMFKGLPTEPDRNYEYTKESYTIAEQRWDDIMDTMIEGFRALKRSDGLYEKELGPYPLHRPKEMSREDFKKVSDKHFQALQKLQKADQEKFEKGMELFSKYFQNLWE